MPKFKYKAKKGPRELVQGSLEAVDRAQAIRLISEMGCFPVEIKEEAHSRASHAVQAEPRLTPFQTSDRAFWNRIFLGRVPRRTITIFTRQLASLFRSQIPVLRSLGLLRERVLHPRMKSIIESVYGDVKEGKPLSEALERFPDLFPSFYLAMISSGEISGKLEEILEQLAKFREKDDEFRGRVQSALAYPLFLLGVGILTVFILLSFVLPRLLGLFKDMETALPLPTQILISVSHLFSKGWPIIIGSAAVFFLVWSHPRLGRVLRKNWDRLRIHLPVIGPLILEADLERFTRTLSLLIKSGLPVIQAVEASAATVASESIREEFIPVKQEIADGKTLSSALERVHSVPSYVRDMTAVGEESGRLDEILEGVANDYVFEIEHRTKLATSLLEPLIILIIGTLVGFIVLAMLLPIFEFNLAVQ